MSHLFKFTGGHVGEFPGATFKIHDVIPQAECQTAGGQTNVEEIAAEANAQSKAHTFVSGKLYTDLSVAQMTSFCSVAYVPQT